MINKDLEKIIGKYKITKTDNILYGTNIPMPKMIIPTPWKTYISFEKTEYYFFLFDESGIYIYLRFGEDYLFIPWSDVVAFKVKKVPMIGKMIIQTKEYTLKFQINRFVFGCPWIKSNLIYLEGNNYFYNK